ncbi:MAG: succinate--CoA ligase subunit beta, partial [Cyanobacteria bacterium J149]
MNLLEYQAKQLFRQVGIPVLPSQTISHPSQLKQLTIPYPIVIKSQVYAGGRGKAGGIKFVDNTIDAIAAARSIFNLPIAGEYPEVLLAESQYDADRELFFAILLDYELQCPVIFGSSQGGIDIEQLLNNLQKVEITDDFSAFYARRLAIRMGLESDLIEKIVDVIEKMYHLFITKDLDLIEINPLGISANKEVMALDGRVRVNDDALGRHPDLLSVTLSDKNNQPPFSARHKLELASALNTPTLLDWQDERGKIAIITNSFDEAVLTWDWLSQAKGKPNRVWLVGESSNGQILPDTVLIKQLITAMTEAPTIGAIKV